MATRKPAPRTCSECPLEVEPKATTCSDRCRARRARRLKREARATAAVAAAPKKARAAKPAAGPADTVPQPDSRPAGGHPIGGHRVEERTLRELTAAGVEDTALGGLCLALARRVDEAAGGWLVRDEEGLTHILERESASQLAGLARELRALIAAALEDQGEQEDELSTLAKRHLHAVPS